MNKKSYVRQIISVTLILVVLFFSTPDLTANAAGGFSDVPSGQYYTDPVIWAVKNSITNGTSTDTFSPNAGCTRGQIVTFLWRANGSPAPKVNTNPFLDVKEGQYYYQPILWAIENQITNGTSSTTFSPEEVCTRGQVVTFLWRNVSSPKVSGNNAFKDVKASDYYATAVMWAVQNGITNGTSQSTFSPNEKCTRAQIVTFLYRYAGNGNNGDGDNTDHHFSGELPYIFNINSHVFHYSNCSSVSRMNEENKVVFEGTREEAIAKGYTPCERCNP